MSAYSDERLVMEALDDSDLAFGQLVKQYQYRVLRTIASIISDEQAAQDLVQETFLRAWSDLPKLREKQKFGGWLNQIAVNLSRHWLRDQQRHHPDTVPLREDTVILAQELRYQREKLRQEVWDAIDGLAESYREIVILHYISGYSYKEIGEMLSVPFSTVSGRLQKARNQLRKEFLDMVTKLQLEIDSTLHGFLKEYAKQDGVSIEVLIIQLIERYKRDMDNPEIAVRKVEIPDTMGAPSPDGRYLSFVEWNSGNLAVRDLTTGEYRNLTNEGIWDRPWQWAEFSIWSPDGKQVGYTWYVSDRCQLRIVGLDGSEPRVLYRNENRDWDWVQPYQWSRDSKSILAWFYKKTGPNEYMDEIVLVSVADGSVRVLKSGRIGPTKMSLSPDGRYVVYDHREKLGEPRDIFLLATDGSGEIPLVEHPADDYGPVWTPDGKAIVFISGRSGTYDAWLMQMTDGKPVTKPTLVRRNIGEVLPMAFTRNGSLYYSIDVGGRDIYIATLDPATGELLSPPTKAICQFEGFNHSPAWSPDGKYLAYLSKRRAVPTTAGGAIWSLMIRSMETGEERELHERQAPRRIYLHWSPDGRSILYGSTKESLRLLVVDVQTGDVTPIAQFDPADKVGIRDAVWSSDGKAIFYIKVIEYSRSIVVRNLETGKEKELHQGVISGLAVSPDGRQLIFTSDKAIKVMSTEDGEPHEILRLKATEEFPWYTGLAWTPDGRYILFGKKRSGEPDGLWRIPTEGGEPQKLLAMDALANIRVHPDGRRIAFTSGWRAIEVWAMENFLPGFTATRQSQ